MSPRRLVALLGWAFLALGCFSLACTVSTAREGLAVALGVVSLAEPSAPPPSAAPQPASTPPPPLVPPAAIRHTAVHTTFAVLGTASVSDQVTNGSSNSTTVSNLLGIEASFARRTERSALTATLPASVALSQRSVGNLNAAYVAPTFAAFYRSESLTPFGQLAVGSLPRAFGLQTRMEGTDVEILGGANLADGGRTFRFVGARGKRALGRGVVSLGVLAGRARDGNGSSFTLLGGYATAPGRLDATAEAALSRTRDLVTVPDARAALSYQLRVNYGSPVGYATYVERYLSPSFAGLGGAANSGDRYHGLAFHTQGKASFDLELVDQTTLPNVISPPTSVTRAGLGLTRQLGRGSLSFTASSQRQVSATNLDWQGDLSAGYGFTLGGATYTSSNVSLQRERSIQGGAVESLRTGLGVATTLRNGTRVEFEASSTNQHQTSSEMLAGGAQGNVTARIAVARRFGSWALSFTDALARVTGQRTDAIQNSAYVTLGRRVSPSIALQAQYGIQTLRDRFDPTPRRPSTIFNVSLGGPFALGNGDRIGHADPRLPATISGAVVSSEVPGSDVGANGIAGITVVLDGTATRRTDFLGRFEFPFVAPGRHEVAVEPAGLPRGYTPDFPFLDVTVDGGQTAQAMLGISASAAIEGHIYGTGADGTRIPIPNVAVELDGEHRVDSGPNGGFGFGHLAAGKHTIALVASTLPADFLIPDVRRTVDSMLGAVSIVDFASAPLGSIAGSVVAPSPIGDDVRAGPLPNVYVVAEPGDHAAITDESGAFLIDNLPAGSYTLTVDDETLPRNDAGASDAQRITLATGAHLEGVRFTVNEKQRDIDFSFKGAQVTTLQVQLGRRVVPPGGASSISVISTSKVDGVQATAFGKTIALHAADRRHWTGELIVPLGTANGPADVTVNSGSLLQHAGLIVDNTIALAGIELSPFHPHVGEYVTVRAHFVAPAHPGDRITWRDGQVTLLARRISGRVYTFSVKITELPFAGLLYCSSEVVPITLSGR